MTRQALGRGLSALIREPESSGPATEAPAPSPLIPIEAIDPSPFQPRTHFGDAELKELAESIRAKGVVQPVLVRRQGERYQLVAGERRWRAAKLAGLDSVPALVREIDDREALELALTENLMRDDLGPLEAARAYYSLQERFGASHEEIADRLGVSRASVTNTLRLLRLPGIIQELIAKGDLTAGHARAILSVPEARDQVILAEQVARRGLSVRETERLAALRREAAARGDTKPEAKPGEDGQEAPGQDPNVRAAVVELERKLGTRVRITGDGQRGKIEISYFSAEDLNRLYEAMMGPSA